MHRRTRSRDLSSIHWSIYMYIYIYIYIYSHFGPIIHTLEPIIHTWEPIIHTWESNEAVQKPHTRNRRVKPHTCWWNHTYKITPPHNQHTDVKTRHAIFTTAVCRPCVLPYHACSAFTTAVCRPCVLPDHACSASYRLLPCSYPAFQASVSLLKKSI
jgi:hypothetical protein